MDLSQRLMENSCKLEKSEVLSLCEKAKQQLEKQPNVIWLNELPESGVLVVGDIHGNDKDLLHVLNLHGTDGKTYVFLGDYIDRGMKSLRVLMLVLSMLVEKKSQVICLRGNHECEVISKIYGFHAECKKVYGDEEGVEIFDACLDVCRHMPLACVVSKKYMLVHAGLSPSIKKIQDIDTIERTKIDLVDVPEKLKEEGWCYKKPYPLIDLLWSDPDEEKQGWEKSPRGCSYLFGVDVTKQFCEVNGVELIIRSHQLVMEGAKYCHDGKVLTIFSASNYCNRCDNLGGVALITEKEGVKTITYKVTLSLEKELFEIQMKLNQKKDLGVTLEEVDELEKRVDDGYAEKKELLKKIREHLGKE